MKAVLGDAPAPLTDHPAKYSPELLAAMRPMLQAEARRVVGRRAADERQGPLLVVDPFAGVGRIHDLASKRPPIRTIGIELQPRWAACRPYRGTVTLGGQGQGTLTGDYRHWLPRIASNERIDVVATSPCYGNRLADHHNARDGSTRHSYTHDYGQPLEPGNSGVLQWGREYRAFHVEAYGFIYRALGYGGLFLLNVSDFFKGKQLVPAVGFHLGAALGAGFTEVRTRKVITPRMRGQGTTTKQAEANPDGPAATDARATHEVILVFRKGAVPRGT